MYYKLTDENCCTYNGTKWGAGITHEAYGNDGLCSGSWIHFYDDPVLAVFFNPIHANFKNPKLWEVEIDGEVLSDNGIKFGAHKVTTIREIPLPVLTTDQIITIAITIAKCVYTDSNWNDWADNWINGTNRTNATANAAANAAYAAAIDFKSIVSKIINNPEEN